jgi:adenylylsulfate kinase
MNRRDLVRPVSGLSRGQREQMNGQRALLVWLTGLSGAGKSTLAHALEARLHEQGRRSVVLDGDNIRLGLCADLDFSADGRQENLRRVAEVAKLFIDAGMITIAAFISPMRADRQMVRQIVGPENFLEVQVQCPLAVCESRDVKGMYRRARAGEIKEFTGVSAPYETPITADLILDTSVSTVEACLRQLDNLLDRTKLGSPHSESW